MPDITYPFLDDALAFLFKKQAVSGKQFAALSQRAKLQYVGSQTIQLASTASDLRQELHAAVKAGEDERQFADRINGKVDLLRSDANRILRTNTKQAYLNGMTTTLEKPHIANAFPYVLYVATHDGRTRPEHRAMDGKIARVGSTEYAAMLEMQSWHNCRCTLIPLSAKQAKQRGADVPDDLLPTAAAVAV